MVNDEDIQNWVKAYSSNAAFLEGVSIWAYNPSPRSSKPKPFGGDQYLKDIERNLNTRYSADILNDALKIIKTGVERFARDDDYEFAQLIAGDATRLYGDETLSSQLEIQLKNTSWMNSLSGYLFSTHFFMYF